MLALQPFAKRNFLLLSFNQFPRRNSNLAWQEIFDYSSVCLRGVYRDNYDFYKWLKVPMFVSQLYSNVWTQFSRLIRSNSCSKLPFQNTPPVTWNSVSVLSLHVTPVWSHDPLIAAPLQEPQHFTWQIIKGQLFGSWNLPVSVTLCQPLSGITVCVCVCVCVWWRHARVTCSFV
jgi:hypothetical protein